MVLFYQDNMKISGRGTKDDENKGAISAPLQRLVRRLHCLGPYEIKHTVIGYWVDGRDGFLVAGYFDKQEDALAEAIDHINRAKKYGGRPVWLYA